MAFHPPIDPAFREAAVRLARGSSLEAAAREGGGDLDDLNTYRREHPDVWERFVRVELRRCLGRSCSEAVLVLGKLMRSADKTISHRAAACLHEVRLTTVRHGKVGGARLPFDPTELLRESSRPGDP